MIRRNNNEFESKQRDGLSRRLVLWAAIVSLLSMLLLVGFHGHPSTDADADAYCGICDLGHHVSNHQSPPPSLFLVSVSYYKPVAVVPFFSISSPLITSAHVRAPPSAI